MVLMALMAALAVPAARRPVTVARARPLASAPLLASALWEPRPGEERRTARAVQAAPTTPAARLVLPVLLVLAARATHRTRAARVAQASHWVRLAPVLEV